MPDIHTHQNVGRRKAVTRPMGLTIVVRRLCVVRTGRLQPTALRGGLRLD